MTDSSRVADLRRRVQEDPASIVFAQLAEELRRSGATEEAVAVCRVGLQRHPGYLTARVTLGRALVELDRLDEAFQELTTVLDIAPGNLPAIRALAEVYQRRGLMSEALVHYRRALQLAQHDSDLERTVGQIQQQVEPSEPEPGLVPATAVNIEALFDFDALLAQLGPPAPMPTPIVVPAAARASSPPGIVEPAPDATDEFAVMEQRLREREAQQEREAREAEAERRRLVILRDLEHWLDAIASDRAASRA